MFLLKMLGTVSLLFLLGTSSRIRILILGDSLTEGYGVDPEAAFPRLVAHQLDSLYPERFEIINGGVSGSTTASALTRLAWYSKSKPNIVVLALGSNDGLRGIEVKETRRNIQSAIDYCLAHHWKVLLVGLKVPPNYGKDYSLAFDSSFSLLARKNNLPLLPFLLEGVAGERELNQADGIHPNELGHAHIALTVLHFLENNLPIQP